MFKVMTLHVPTGPRRVPSRGVYWRRRAIVLLSLATVASTPVLLATGGVADAATSVPEPIRAVAARKEIPRVAAGPTASTTPKPVAVVKKPVSAEALLADSRVTLSENARADLRNGLVDPRLVSLLGRLADTYQIEISVFSTGHGRFVKGTTKVSNHVYGRAADITFVNGAEVSGTNEAARALAQLLLNVDPSIRPTEVGGPWDIDDADGVGFTDSGHRAHLHVGFDV